MIILAIVYQVLVNLLMYLMILIQNVQTQVILEILKVVNFSQDDSFYIKSS